MLSPESPDQLVVTRALVEHQEHHEAAMTDARNRRMAMTLMNAYTELMVRAKVWKHETP